MRLRVTFRNGAEPIDCCEPLAARAIGEYMEHELIIAFGRRAFVWDRAEVASFQLLPEEGA